MIPIQLVFLAGIVFFETAVQLLSLFTYCFWLVIFVERAVELFFIIQPFCLVNYWNACKFTRIRTLFGGDCCTETTETFADGKVFLNPKTLPAGYL